MNRVLSTSIVPLKRVASLRLMLAFAVAIASSAPAFAADPPLYKLVARDGAFDPSVIEVPAGTRVRLEIVNDGKTPIEFESRDLKQEKVIPPGGKATMTINALKTGEYRFFDDFHQKTGQGRLVAR